MKTLFLIAVSLMIAGCDAGKGTDKAPAKQAAAEKEMQRQQEQQAREAEAAKQRDEGRAQAKASFNQAFSYLGSAKAATAKEAKEKLLHNAEIEFTNAISKDANYVEAYFNRGVVYMALGKMNKAEEDLKKAIAIDAKNADAHYNLACLYSLTNRLDLAADSLDAALQNGFKNIDSLRSDSDLDALRKTREFRKVLDRNKIFIN